MKSYDHRRIEKKWQTYWEKKKLNVAKENTKKKKFYGLIEFPYPSGDGLHVGHIRSNTAMDIIARKRRAEGFNVLYPIGWDAFGLPTENYAIKTGIQPSVVTKNNTNTFRKQLKALGFSFDWSREVNTTDPAYYKWTQWIFLKFFERGLAYKKKMAINWCPKDKIGLANEEVVEGKCERCGTAVEKREKEQWMLAITKYADRLDSDLDPKKILIGTRNAAKVKMIKVCLAGVAGIELISLDDIPKVDDGALVEGDDFLENAKMKSEFYFKKTGIPTISTDHILWIEKWPENKGFMIHMRKHANPGSPRATDEEVVVFLKKFLESVGGESKANFHYGISYTDEKGTFASDNIPADYILQNKTQAKSYWPGYPTEALLKDVKTDMFKANQTDDVRYVKLMKFLKEKFVPRMLSGRTPVDYLEKIRIQQRNWIGRSEGVEIEFPIINFQLSKKDKLGKVKVFTTRPDTLFGATYLVLAPEHPLVEKIKNQISNKNEMLRYIVTSKKKSEIERTTDDKEKTGVEIKGIKAINPANGEEIPVWVADYVLGDYGTGAIMAVPAHDARDFEFAKKFGLAIKHVVAPYFLEEDNPTQKGKRVVPRKAVECYVRNPKNGKYLFVEWHNVDWRTVVTGGIELSEDVIEAGKREVREETGYKNLNFVKVLGGPIRVDFYHPVKDENREAEFYGVFFELENEEQEPINDKELAKHSYKWLEEKEVLNFINKGRLFFKRLITNQNAAYVEEGVLVNSGTFNNLTSREAQKKITEFVGGKMVTTFKLRDWVFSRQRYWGEPIPVIHCGECGAVPVPEKDLPVKLPRVKNYKPTDTGESPLAAISKWVNVKCPVCHGPAKRETDTMPNWAGSSWYYLAYAMHCKLFPKSKVSGQWSRTVLDYWTPVDWYNGGMEHTTLHLLYSRFWHKFLFDLGLVPTNEPYLKRTSHGLILGEGGAKMSKSVGNVVNPDMLIKQFGADTLRLYEMFLGPFEQHIAWSTESMIGPRRFLEKTWKFQGKLKAKVQKSKEQNEPTAGSRTLTTILHRTIKKVSEDIEAMRFNTAVSALMVLSNEFEKASEISRNDYEIFLRLLAPFAPHITEELWLTLGHRQSIHLEPWPVFDPNISIVGNRTIVVQVNGKVRATFEHAGELSETEARKKSLGLPEIKKWLAGKAVQKVIYVTNRLVSIVATTEMTENRRTLDNKRCLT